MPTTPVLNSIVDWLRDGYPDGVPVQDYIPLLALLARRLSDDEVADVAAQVASPADGSASDADIRALITKITHEPPRREDMDRVRAHLQRAGEFF
jgi:hypothetical protein